MAKLHISLKIATSLDGKIALQNGESKWITSEASRRRGRQLRAANDGICIGANTAVLDDPMLTVRENDAEDPVRIVFDSRLRTPLIAQLIQTAQSVPTWIFHDEALNIQGHPLTETSAKLIPVPKIEAGLDLMTCVAKLSKLGLRRLLIEGGGTLAASFLRADLVNEIHWFRAPIIIGGNGRNCIGDMPFKTLDSVPVFERKSLEQIDQDIYEVLKRK